jgi:hypothetical protein
MRDQVEVTPQKAILPRIKKAVAGGNRPIFFDARRHLGSWYAVLGLTNGGRQTWLMDTQPFWTRDAALQYAHQLMRDAVHQHNDWRNNE